MSIIDKKGRLFGKVNIVDLLVILAVLFIGVGLVWNKFGAKISGEESKRVKMTTQLRIKGASDFMFELLQNESPVGKQLVSGTEYLKDTNVEAIRFENYTTQVVTDDGRIILAEDPTRQDIYITVTSYVQKGSLINKIGNQEVRVGRTMTFKVDNFETYANIIDVEFEETENTELQ